MFEFRLLATLRVLFGQSIWRNTRFLISVSAIGLTFAGTAMAGAGQPNDRPSQAASATSQFDVQFDKGAIVGLQRRHDPGEVQYLPRERRLGDVVLRWRKAGEAEWRVTETSQIAAAGEGIFATPSADESLATYELTDGPLPALRTTIRLAVEEGSIAWTIGLKNLSDGPIEIGDLAVPLPISSPFGRGRERARGPMLMKHSFISGHGSFLYWTRSDGAGPNLMLVPTENTHFEYWDTGSQQLPDARAASDASASGVANRARRVFHAYIHSAAAGAVAKSHGTNWRQPHTSLTLAPNGQAADARSYGLQFRWADGLDGVRQALVDEGLIDVQVVPGMTVPTDLVARFALRTKHDIHAVEAEHPDATQITPLEPRGDYRLYEVRFRKLGENRLNVYYGNKRQMHLEFFVTEPLETLIKKRGAFIARRQHRDPTKWYNGLVAEWNMESQVLLGPDNYDRISGFRIYAVTCDDPGLSKPAFLAAKNAEHPLQNEVEALDYYIQHFVWGGLQMTTDEKYPYAIYGIQDWKRNRDSDDPGRNGRLHIWRCYDYPHIVLMYHSMYRVAKNNPHITTALPAREYLQRAYGTAMALFTVPYEVERWSAYRTGFYNELVIVDLIDDLAAAGMTAEAGSLREHWERKVDFFVNGRPDLFRSEYPFDSTGFESTHALAKYAVQRAAENLAGADGQKGLDAAQRFLQRQIAANLFCRGSIEPAYFLLGSDYRGSGGNSYTLTYMSQMGGWALLDYALNFAAKPAADLRLGYASYLSAWALMNTGTPESNYGYWYPGEANDGGAGGGFEPAPFGRTWLGQPHHRGSWYYACEIDLGYCGALRAARTVLADDPIFGRTCFGGDWRTSDAGIEVTPKDGVRRRFHVMLGDHKLHLELETDRFAADVPLVLQENLGEIQFVLESDNQAEHPARLELSGLSTGRYTVSHGDEQVASLDVDKEKLKFGRSVTVDIRLPEGGRSNPIVVSRVNGPRR
jgi:hypothetical protein